jgi:hypothetical protein
MKRASAIHANASSEVNIWVVYGSAVVIIYVLRKKLNGQVLIKSKIMQGIKQKKALYYVKSYATYQRRIVYEVYVA